MPRPRNLGRIIARIRSQLTHSDAEARALRANLQSARRELEGLRSRKMHARPAARPRGPRTAKERRTTVKRKAA